MREELDLRATLKFVVGTSAPVDSNRDAVAEQATNKLVQVAWDAVDKLCEDCGEALSESFGNFDRVVALGWLIADALGILDFERQSAYKVGLKAYKLAQALPQQIASATKPLRRKLSKLPAGDRACQQLTVDIAIKEQTELQKPFEHELLVHRPHAKRQRDRPLPIEERVAMAKAGLRATQAKTDELAAVAKKEVADVPPLPSMVLWHEDLAAYDSKRRRGKQALERAKAAHDAFLESKYAFSVAASKYVELLGEWERDEAEQRRLEAEWDDDVSPIEIADILEKMVATVAVSSSVFAHCESCAMALIEQADAFGWQEMDQMQEALRRGLPTLPFYPPDLRDAHVRSLPFGLSFMGHVSAIAWQHAVQSVKACSGGTAGVLTASGEAVSLQMLSNHYRVAAWEVLEREKIYMELGL